MEAGQGKPYLLLISSTAKPTVGASSAVWARLGCSAKGSAWAHGAIYASRQLGAHLEMLQDGALATVVKAHNEHIQLQFIWTLRL